MPTQCEVKVTSKGQVVRGEFNMIEIKGYDHTNNKNFTKAFFETKRDGSLTKNAEIANTLVQNDWITITLDDTSYHNVQSIRKTGEPAGGSAAAAAAPAPGLTPAAAGGANTSDKMSKAEWAEKDRKKAVSVARSVAIKAATSLFGGKPITKAIIAATEKLAYRMEAYLMKGSFDAELDPDEPIEPPAPAVTTTAPVNQAGLAPAEAPIEATDRGPTPTDQSVAGVDDDIPF